MLERIQSKVWKGEPRCDAEMKVGVQLGPLRTQSSNVAKVARDAGVIPPWPAPPDPQGDDR